MLANLQARCLQHSPKSYSDHKIILRMDGTEKGSAGLCPVLGLSRKAGPRPGRKRK